MMRMRALRVSALTLLGCLLGVGFAAAQAQITTGVIQGSVLDPSGAVAVRRRGGGAQRRHQRRAQTEHRRATDASSSSSCSRAPTA